MSLPTRTCLTALPKMHVASGNDMQGLLHVVPGGERHFTAFLHVVPMSDMHFNAFLHVVPATRRTCKKDMRLRLFLHVLRRNNMHFREILHVVPGTTCILGYFCMSFTGSTYLLGAFCMSSPGTTYIFGGLFAYAKMPSNACRSQDLRAKRP